MKNIVVLGASGSIGLQALDVIRNNQDRFSLTKISIGYNIEALFKILEEFTSIKEVALLEKKCLKELQDLYPEIKFYLDNIGILKLLDNNDYDIVLNAIVGFDGLLPSLKTLESDKVLALANKETMVVGGEIVKQMLVKHPQAQIIPVDSEHCAIFQCITNGKKAEVKKIIISASGGSFRDKTLAELKGVSVQEALNHPNWNMGDAITIDSATMLNKGLEVIEAHYLFDIAYDNIEVVIHRESIVHSLVEFKDSSIIAQLSMPNMKQPIIYALGYPNRLDFSESSLNFNEMINLSFQSVDYERFKGLALAFKAGRLGHSYPCVLNASKEVATQAFLNNEIEFLAIVELVQKALESHKLVNNPSIVDLINVDKATRLYVKSIMKEYINGNS